MDESSSERFPYALSVADLDKLLGEIRRGSIDRIDEAFLTRAEIVESTRRQARAVFEEFGFVAQEQLTPRGRKLRVDGEATQQAATEALVSTYPHLWARAGESGFDSVQLNTYVSNHVSSGASSRRLMVRTFSWLVGLTGKQEVIGRLAGRGRRKRSRRAPQGTRAGSRAPHADSEKVAAGAVAATTAQREPAHEVGNAPQDTRAERLRALSDALSVSIDSHTDPELVKEIHVMLKDLFGPAEAPQ